MDRLYSSCTIFKALALVYTRACLSLLPSILGNYFLFTFNPVKLHTACVFSHRKDYGVRMLTNKATDFNISCVFDMKLQKVCSKQIQKSLTFVFISYYTISYTNDGSSSMFVSFKTISCLFFVTLMELFFGGEFIFLLIFLIRIALQCFYLSDDDKGMVCDLCKGIFVSSCHL